MDEETPLLNPKPVTPESKIRNSKLFLAVFSAILGNFNFGYSLVYTSPVLSVLQSPDTDPRIRLNDAEAAWFGSIYALGAAAGGLGGMLLNDKIGRKMSIMMSALPSALGYLLLSAAVDQWMLYLGRFLTGVAGGMTGASIPVYISEISHKAVRGALGTSPQITAVLGTLCLYALGLRLSWRWLAVVGLLPTLLMVLLLPFMPSSPRRLLSTGNEERAEKALKWLRGEHYDPQVEILVMQHSMSQQGKITLTQLGTPAYYKPILISVGMRFLQQLSGITPILVYLEKIFSTENVPLESKFSFIQVMEFLYGGIRSNWCSGIVIRLPASQLKPRLEPLGERSSILNKMSSCFGFNLKESRDLAFIFCKAAALVGLVRLISVIISAFLMDKAGRKALLYTSSILIFLSTLTMTMITHTPVCNPGTLTSNVTLCGLGYSSLNGAGNTAAVYIPLISIMVFIFGYALGWGTIPWLLMSEVLPLIARGVASGLCVTVSWLTAFVLTLAFTHLLTWGRFVPYLIFMVLSVFGLLFIALCVPETRRRSLEEIENYFRTGRTFTIARYRSTMQAS